MKLMDRYDALVIENYKLKEEVDRLVDALRDERDYINTLRESLDHYKQLHVERGNEIQKLWNRIHDMSTKFVNYPEFHIIADRLVENDDPKNYNKIGRIKEFREKTMCGLREAKDAIEAAMERKVAKDVATD